MMPNINPRQMDQMMRKMGVKQEDIDAEQVIIICSDKKIVIDNPSVQKVNMMGKESYQISGEESEESLDSVDAEDDVLEISEDDLKTVMEQTGGSEEEALQALEDTNGNIAEAIILLTAEKEE
jgi:nascent polypeptide-associated complex subunit alpha